MKTVIFALAFCLAAAAALARDAVSPAPAPAPPVEAAAQAMQDVTGSIRCKQVVVAVDEGYGVTSHETRTICAPHAEN